MKNAHAFVIAFCCLPWMIHAQDNHIRPSAIGISFLYNDFTTAQRIRRGSLKKVFQDRNWAKFSEMSPGLGISYFKGLHRHLDFAVTFDASFVRDSFTSRAAAPGDALLMELDATVQVKMLPENYRVSPYLMVGMGTSRYKSYYGAFLPLGGGVKVNIFKEAALYFTASYRMPVTPDYISHHFNYSLGLAGVIGKKKVPKKITTPPQLIDRDGDGIFDASDKCPDVPGLARYQGCPIPDTDRDGINDEADSCITLPGMVRYHGCPIPDSDNDGINDEQDKCPKEKGTTASGGCPEIRQEVIHRMNLAARNIFFNTGSARLLDTSDLALDDVVRIMKEDGNLKLTIEGHTDDVGRDEANLMLSINRVRSVKEYLVKEGIAESRIEVKGFGETRPVADNKTDAGRARNRRVELKVNY